MKIPLHSKVFFALLVLYSFTGKSQIVWIDSVKRVAARQRPDTTAVLTLISISESYQFYYPDSALAYAQRALHMSEKLKYDDGTFRSIVNIHKALFVLGNYALDLDYAFKAQAIGQRISTPFTLGWSNGMLGDCYYNLGEYEMALHYYREVMKIAEANALPDLHEIYSNGAPVFIKLRQYDSALYYAQKGYTLFKQQPRSYDEYRIQYTKGTMFRFLGDAFAGKRLYDSSLFYYRKSIPCSEYVNLEYNKTDVYNGMALVFMNQHHLDSAIHYAKRVFSGKTIQSYPIGLLLAANTLAESYQVQDRPDSTLKYLRLMLSIKDSLFSREKTAAVQNILFKEQEKQREVLAAKTELKNRYWVYSISGLLVVIIVIVIILLRNHRICQLQNVRNQIADDLHDDIGSTLSSISIMNELVKAKSNGESLPLLTSIGENTSIIQENMSDIIWTIQSGNDRFDNVFQRMKQFASDLSEAKNIEFDFASDPALSAMKLPMEKRKNLYLFFKEAITNATKHAEAKTISVRMVKGNQLLELSIADDGKGFDTTQQSNGNGMCTLRKRAADLKGVYKIVSDRNKGTKVQLKFKIT